MTGPEIYQMPPPVMDRFSNRSSSEIEDINQVSGKARTGFGTGSPVT